MAEEILEKFRIVCVGCQKKDQVHHTVLYVDWDVRHYIIMCTDCGVTETYDEEGKKVVIKQERKEVVN